MRRITLLVTVALVMAAMMTILSTGPVAEPNSNACPVAASQGSTFAQFHTGGGTGEDVSSCAQAQGSAFGEFNATFSTPQCAQDG